MKKKKTKKHHDRASKNKTVLHLTEKKTLGGKVSAGSCEGEKRGALILETWGKSEDRREGGYRDSS